LSITTYAEAQAAVKNWLHRSDLDTYIPDFFTFGEARIAREVKARQMEQRVTSITSTSSPYINLPEDLVALRLLWLSSSTRVKLEYMPPDAFFERYTDDVTGKPVAYTVIGDEVRFGPSPDSEYTVELWYYKKLTALSSATNSLFTVNPDLYVYAALCASAPFLKDDNRIAVWEMQFKMAKDSVNETHRETRYGANPRMVSA
jgi:hypothetical protein